MLFANHLSLKLYFASLLMVTKYTDIKKNYKYTQGSGLTAGENTFMKTTVTPFCCNNFTYFSNSEQCSRFDVFFLNP